MLDWIELGLKAAGVIRPFASFASRKLKERHVERVLDDVAKLRFWSDGSIEPLRVIADEKATAHDYETFRWRIQQTDRPAREIGERLYDLRISIAAAHGIEVAECLDGVLSEKFGLEGMRWRLSRMAAEGNFSAQDATVMLDMMLGFNEELAYIHEQIRVSQTTPQPIAQK